MSHDLIATIIGKNKVVQVSDCRLTLNGKEYDAEAIKMVGVVCADARFSIAYSGVGEIEGMRTDYWLVDQVRSIFASGRYGVKTLAWELAVAAEQAMPKLRYAGMPVRREDRWLQLVLAGYHHGEAGPFSQPFVIGISNTRFRGFGVRLGVEPIFTVTAGTLKPGLPDNENYVRIIGEAAGILAEDKRAQSIRRELKQVVRQLKRIDQSEMASGRTTAERLVWIIREAAKHPRYGKVIGQDCLSVVIHPGSPAMPTYYHPKNATTVEHGPHLVTPQLAIIDVEFDLDP